MSAGQFVTETFDFDGGRQVTVYVPREAPVGVVVAGDGELIAHWGPDLALAGAPPVLLVGIHHHRDETLRLHEYSPHLEPDRFAAHETFVVEDVLRWTAARWGTAFPPERTAALGISAGAELALALGLRHPDVVGSVLGASPGAGYRPPEPLPGALPRTYLLAGTQEPFFLANAERWAAALRDAGGEVTMVERTGGHGDPFWRQEFPRMVSWAFA